MSVVAQLAAVYGTLAAGIGLLGKSAYSNSDARGGLALLTVLAMGLNLRYGIYDVGENIAFFVGIYDPLTNLGVTPETAGQMQGMARCTVGNSCSVLDYEYHQDWAAAFHGRFTEGPVQRRAKLYAHIWATTVAFTFAFLQFHQPTRTKYPTLHRYTGWAVTLCTFFGISSALWLAIEHGPVKSYGGNVAVAGWFSMAFTVVGCLVPGVRAAMRRDIPAHQKWMTRYYGAMWGAYLVFRAIFLIMGPLLRSYAGLIAPLAIWVSAPLGVLIAEWVRTRGLAKGSELKRVQ